MDRSRIFRPSAPNAVPGTDLIDWRTDTLVDLLRRRAVATPDLVLYTYLDDGETREISMTASELDAAARSIGRTLDKLAAPGDRIVLLFDDGLDYIAGLFGCLSVGLVAVSGIHPSAPRSSERLLGIIRDCGATVVLGQARVLAEFQRTLDDILDDLDLRWVASDKIKAVAGEARAASAGANNGLALIQYTSGSSRAPRGVMLSHRNILHNLHGQVKAFGYQQGDTGVSWLPFSHDMGLIGCVLMAIYGGGRCVLLSPSHFLEDPLRWLRAISRYRATLSGGPSFAYELCARRAEGMDLGTLDLSSWVIAVNGAEPIRADIVRRFTEAFAPAGFEAGAIHPSYGLAEATLLVTSGEREAHLRTRLLDKASLRRNIVRPLADAERSSDGVELVGCGRSMPDQHLVIVDPKTSSPVEPGEVGEVWIAGPSISVGYFDRPDDNAAYFTGDLGDGHGPYLRTGDLGFLLDGELFVTGRLRDLLVVRGKNYYPQDLEYSAETGHPAIRPGCCACFLSEETGELVVVAEVVRAHEGEVAAIAAAIRESIVRDHGLGPRRVVLTRWGSVLKTPSGKIQRAQTRMALAQGHISPLHDSVAADRPTAGAAPVDMARVGEWFLDRMAAMGVDVSSFDPAMRLTELGFDSLKIVELKADLERDLGIVVPIADLYAFQDIQSLADHLRAEAHRKYDTPPAPPRPSSRLGEQRRRRGAATAAPGGPVSL